MKKLILLPFFLVTFLLTGYSQQVAENNINGYIVKVDYSSKEVSLENKSEPIEIGKISISKNTKLGLAAQNEIEKGTYSLSLYKSNDEYYFGFSTTKTNNEVELLIPVDYTTTKEDKLALLIQISEPTPENGMGILVVEWGTNSARLYLNPAE